MYKFYPARTPGPIFKNAILSVSTLDHSKQFSDSES